MALMVVAREAWRATLHPSVRIRAVIRSIRPPIVAARPAAPDSPRSLQPRIRRWTMDNGPWTMDDGPWTIDHGRWTMDDGRWTMDFTPFAAPPADPPSPRVVPEASSRR